jgi:hypothetical protein
MDSKSALLSDEGGTRAGRALQTRALDATGSVPVADRHGLMDAHASLTP